MGNLLSVVVPVYEASELFPIVLASLINQHYENQVEILICDDGSSKRIFDIFRDLEYSSRYTLRYIWQPHTGNVSVARNAGIKCAQGDVLLFVDGDSIAPENLFRFHMDKHRWGDKLLLSGSREYLLASSHDLDEFAHLSYPEISTYLTRLEAVSYVPFQRSLSFDLRWLACLGCNLSVKRSEAVLFDEEFRGWGFEDSELAFRLLKDHDYSIQVDTTSVVYSPEFLSDRATFSTVRPRTHGEIVDYLYNINYLKCKHPAIKIDKLINICSNFKLNRDTNEWTRVQNQLLRQRTTREVAGDLFFWYTERFPFQQWWVQYLKRDGEGENY